MKKLSFKNTIIARALIVKNKELLLVTNDS